MTELLCSVGPPGELIRPSSRFAILRLSPLCMAAIHKKREQPEEEERAAGRGRTHTHVLRPRLANAACHPYLPSAGARKLKRPRIGRASGVEKDTPMT